MKTLLTIFAMLSMSAFGQTWTGCASPASRQSGIFISPTTRTMYVTLNNNSTDTPPGSIWSTSNLCPTSASQWAIVSATRAGWVMPHPTTGVIYLDNSNAGTVPNTSHMRFLAGNTLTDTASPIDGWSMTVDPVRGVVLAEERNGNVYTSADNFTTPVLKNACAGSPITGIAAVDGVWFALCDSVPSQKSTDGGLTWVPAGSAGGAVGQVIKLPNGSLLGCDQQGNAFPRIYDGNVSWPQMGPSSFPGSSGTLRCSRVIAIGSDVWMAANDATNNPLLYKTSTGTGAWSNMTGTGLPACTAQCQPRDLFFDSPSGYLYTTILGSGGQATSIYRLQVGAVNLPPPPATLTPTGPASYSDKTPFSVNLNLASPTNATDIMFNWSAPAGVTITGITLPAAVSVSKQITCGGTFPQAFGTCVIWGVNWTTLPSGPISVIASTPTGTSPITISTMAVQAVDASGTGIAATGASITIPFVPPVNKCDLDLSGVVDGNDLKLIAQRITARVTPCDFNGDGQCDLFDLFVILRAAIGNPAVCSVP